MVVRGGWMVERVEVDGEVLFNILDQDGGLVESMEDRGEALAYARELGEEERVMEREEELARYRDRVEGALHDLDAVVDAELIRRIGKLLGVVRRRGV